MAGTGVSRMFHLMMIIPAGGLLLLLSLISLGTMAQVNSRVVDELDDKDIEGDCILFAENGDNRIQYNEGDECDFVIAGTALLTVLSLVFTILLVAKGVAGIKV